MELDPEFVELDPMDELESGFVELDPEFVGLDPVLVELESEFDLMLSH